MQKVDWSRDQAAEVLRRCDEADEALNGILALAEAALPDEEKKRVRRALGTVISELYVEIEAPIHRAYPELAPPNLDPSRPMNVPDPH